MDFWHLTLAQFDALAKRYLEDQERRDYRSAMICTILANVYRKKGARAFNEQDFMPKYPKQKKKQTAEEMLETVKLLNKAFGGEE